MKPMFHTHFYNPHSLELLIINLFQILNVLLCLIASSVEHLSVLLHLQGRQPVCHCWLQVE